MRCFGIGLSLMFVSFFATGADDRLVNQLEPPRSVSAVETVQQEIIPFKDDEGFSGDLQELSVRVGIAMAVLAILWSLIVHARKRGLLGVLATTELATIKVKGSRKISMSTQAYVLSIDGSDIVVVDNGKSVAVHSLPRATGLTDDA